MIHIFLDDYRPCPKGFRLARTAMECLSLMRKYKVGILSLDYNLGLGEPTGADLVHDMVKHRLYPKSIIIHSANPYGRLKMYRLLVEHAPKKIPITIRPEPINLGYYL